MVDSNYLRKALIFTQSTFDLTRKVAPKLNDMKETKDDKEIAIEIAKRMYITDDNIINFENMTRP